MKYLLTIISLILTFSSIAQSGKVKITIAPTDAIIKVNGQYYESMSTYDFPIGTYTIEAWKPHHVYTSISFEVKEGDTTYVTFGLPLAREFRRFKSMTFLYKSTVYTCRYVAPIAYGAITFSQWNNVGNLSTEADELFAKATEQKEVHAIQVEQDKVVAATQEYEQLKTLYNLKRDQFYKARRNAILFTSIGGISVIGLEFLSAKIKKPTYVEDVKLVFAPTLFNSSAGIVFNISIPLR